MARSKATDKETRKEKERRVITASGRSVDSKGCAGAGMRSREALYESEDKFRDLAEKSLAGIYLIQDSVFKYGNPKFAEMFGYTVQDVLNGMGPQDMVSPEDWPLVENNIKRRMSGAAESIHYEFRGIKKSGEAIEVEVYGSRIIYGGRPAVIGTMLDITKRKRADELLKRAEEKYRGIFEHAVEGIFQITPLGQFVVINPALEKMLGYGSSEELTASLRDMKRQLYVVPACRSEFMRILEANGEVLGYECELFKKDGSTIWVEMNARAIRGIAAGISYFEGTVEDITEQKKAEDALRKLNEFNAAIIDNAPVAIFTLDMDGVITSVNPALASISGLGDEAEEKLLGFNWLKNPYTLKCGLAGHIERGLQGEPFQLWDFPYITYRGDRTLYMDFKGVPLRGKEGNVEGLLCLIEETTDRVKTRAKLMQETRMSAIGRLAAGIAHELNNPLATLVAHSELAGHCLESFRELLGERPDLEELKIYLNIIEAQAFRCKNVTSDILNLPWKEGFEIEDIDVNRLLVSILEFADLEPTRGKIIRDFCATLPSVRGDIGALRQVFVNLINNAADAVEGRMEATIWIRTKLDAGRVLVEVEDNGIGIPDAIIEKIFEPFFTTKESKKGIGLGLALCYEFLNHMGGTIRTESKPGYKTIFSVTLPTEDNVTAEK
jgi:two-component system, cell cycle sensor histidine kinase and response regulator CckA